MLETTIQLMCLIFGIGIVIGAITLFLFLYSRGVFDDGLSAIEFFLGAIAMGMGFIVYGIRGKQDS